MKLKKASRRLVAFCASLAILAGCFSLLSPYAQAAKNTYTSLEDLGKGTLWHYNAVLFGDWHARQADVEGAIAVQNSVKLATTGPFSIGANVQKLVMGNYNPAKSKFPIAVFGLQGTGASLDLGTGKNGVQTYGDLVYPASRQALYDSAVATANPNGSRKFEYMQGGPAPLADSLVEDFFTYAKNTSTKILNLFGGYSTPSVQGSGNNSTFKNWATGTLWGAKPSTYEVTIPGMAAGTRVLVINVESDNLLTIEGLPLNAGFEDYDLIVLNCPYAGSVSFTSSFNIFSKTDGTVFGNGAGFEQGTARHDRMVEWATRLVWLFPNANDLAVNGAGVLGSIVAPNARVVGNGGSINGMLFAKDLEQVAGFEMHAFSMNPIVIKTVDGEQDPEPDPVYADVSIAKRGILFSEDAYYPGLAGAELQLQYRDESGQWQVYQEYKSIITGDGGAVTLKKLPAGQQYRLVELTPPTGYYHLGNEATYFTIDGDGNVTPGITGSGGSITNDTFAYTDSNGTFHEIGIQDKDGTIVVYNRRVRIEIPFVKQDDSGSALTGAVFGLRMATPGGDIIVDSAIRVENADGTFSIGPLGVGTYKLYEHTPPTGFERPAADHIYTIVVTQTSYGVLEATVTDWEGNPAAKDAGGNHIVVNKRLQAGEDPSYFVEFLKVTTIDGQRQPLEGGSFDLYQEVFPTVQPGLGTVPILPQALGDAPDADAVPTLEPSEPDEPQPDGDQAGPTGTQEEAGIEDDGAKDGVGPDAYVEPNAEQTLADAPQISQENEDSTSLADDGQTGEPLTPEEPVPAHAPTGGIQESPFFGPTGGAQPEYDLVHEGRYWKRMQTGLTASGNPSNTGLVLLLTGVQVGESYLLHEVTPPVGYTYTGAGEYTIVDITSESTAYTRVFVQNTPVNGSFRFVKTDGEGNSLTGAVFGLYRENENGDYLQVERFTMSEADRVLTDLQPDQYMLEEIAAPTGHLLPATAESRRVYFTITTGGGTGGNGTKANPYTGLHIGASTPIEIVNEPFYTAFMLRKLDLATEATLPGVEFLVEYRTSIMEDWQPYLNSAHPEGRFITDQNGEVWDNLREGMYRISEIKALAGYKITSAMYVFTVDAATTDRTVTLRVFNELKLTGATELVKYDAENTALTLPGAEFELLRLPDDKYRYAIQDLAEGTLTPEAASALPDWYMLADGLTTNENGQLPLTGLESGLYMLVEKRAPEGYSLWNVWDRYNNFVIFEMRYTVDEELGKQAVLLGDIWGNHTGEAGHLEMLNNPATGTGAIKVTKVDYYDNDIPLPGTTFALSRYGGSAPVQMNPGMEAVPEALLAEKDWYAYTDPTSNRYTTGATGSVTIEGLAPGVYKLEEVIPPEGYGLWGDETDVIYFEMIDASRLPTDSDIRVGAILGNHVTADGEIVFADEPLPKAVTPPPTDPKGPESPGPTPDSPKTGDNASGLQALYLLLSLCMALAIVFVASLKHTLYKKRVRAYQAARYASGKIVYRRR